MHSVDVNEMSVFYFSMNQIDISVQRSMCTYIEWTSTRNTAYGVRIWQHYATIASIRITSHVSSLILLNFLKQ